jgi:hypothetical protein
VQVWELTEDAKDREPVVFVFPTAVLQQQFLAAWKTAYLSNVEVCKAEAAASAPKADGQIQ